MNTWLYTWDLYYVVLATGEPGGPPQNWGCKRSIIWVLYWCSLMSLLRWSNCWNAGITLRWVGGPSLTASERLAVKYSFLPLANPTDVPEPRASGSTIILYVWIWWCVLYAFIYSGKYRHFLRGGGCRCTYRRYTDYTSSGSGSVERVFDMPCW